MAVITSLINKGVSEYQIKQIFLSYPIGEKYRSHSSKDAYLMKSIESAKKSSDLTEEEMINPLFITGAINKANNKSGVSHKMLLEGEETGKFYEQ